MEALLITVPPGWRVHHSFEVSGELIQLGYSVHVIADDPDDPDLDDLRATARPYEQ